MPGINIGSMEGSVPRNSPDVASLTPLPEDVEAFEQAMNALDDTPGAITQQQGKAAKETPQQRGTQAQKTSEKLRANTTTQEQGKAATETTPQTDSQAQTTLKKQVTDEGTQQQGKMTSQDDSRLQRFEKAPRPEQKGLKLDDERLMQALGAGEKRKTAKGDDGLSSLPPMNGPLDGLLGAPGKVGASPEMGPANTGLHIDNEMVQKCVERILVSRPEDGASEVRIQIGRDVLPDTEICLNRAMDGQLIVHMYTANESSFQSMVAMRNDLLNTLEQREGNAVRVEISFQNNAETGDMNRRSRGYIQQDDDQPV